jgi:hypothetical protein
MDAGEVREELDALGKDGFVKRHGKFYLVVTDASVLDDFAEFVNTATRDANDIASKGGLKNMDVRPLQPGESGKISVGREADVSIAQKSISKVHCWFAISGGLLQLSDAGSKNGTWLNGRALKASQWVPVDVGDTINFGSVTATIWAIDDLAAALK